MFSYYRNLLTSTIKINSIPEGAGREDMNALDRMSELNAQQTAQQKLEAAKVALSQIKGTDVAALEEAVAELPAEAREEAGKLLLETVVQRVISGNEDLLKGVFQSAVLGKTVQFDSDSSVWDSNIISASDVRILEKYGYTQDTIIAALNLQKDNVIAGKVQRGPTADEILAYQKTQEPIRHVGGDAGEALVVEMNAAKEKVETETLARSQNEASDARLIARAQEQEKQVGREELASAVKDFFAKNPTLTVEDFHAEADGIEYNDGWVKDTQAMDKNTMDGLLARGISLEDIVTAFNDYRGTQVENNTLMAQREQRNADAMKEYGESRASAAKAEYYANIEQTGGDAIVAENIASQAREEIQMTEAQKALPTTLANLNLSDAASVTIAQDAINNAVDKSILLETIGKEELAVDGIAGPNTRKAIQVAINTINGNNELEVDGKIGSLTLAALQKVGSEESQQMWAKNFTAIENPTV